MAASSFVPTGTRRGSRALVARTAARTAPRGAGLAPVIALPLRGPVSQQHAFELPAERPEDRAAVRPSLALVEPPARAGVQRTRAVVAALVLTLLLAAVAVISVGGRAAGGVETSVAGHVVLQPGETLWDIAVRSAPAGVDPRRQLDTLRRLNAFGPGPLDAWTVVLIPAA